MIKKKTTEKGKEEENEYGTHKVIKIKIWLS